MKVLKSFSTAHEAVRWLNNNPIDGTSIEMTHSLKSIGHAGRIPSGNYHVVLKRTELGKIRDNADNIAKMVKGDRETRGETLNLDDLDGMEVGLANIARGLEQKTSNTPGLRGKRELNVLDGTRERVNSAQDAVNDRLYANLSVKSIVEEVVNRVLKATNDDAADWQYDGLVDEAASGTVPEGAPELARIAKKIPNVAPQTANSATSTIRKP